MSFVLAVLFTVFINYWQDVLTFCYLQAGMMARLVDTSVQYWKKMKLFDELLGNRKKMAEKK